MQLKASDSSKTMKSNARSKSYNAVKGIRISQISLAPLTVSQIPVVKGKNIVQYKKPVVKVNPEDIQSFQKCYQIREDSIFQMRISILQLIENSFSKSNQEILTNVRNTCTYTLEQEKYRTSIEDKIISKYEGQSQVWLEQNSTVKQMVFKLCQRICRTNNSFFQKVQFYFPRLAEIIQQEQCQWNSSFKDSLQHLLLQIQNNKNITLSQVLTHISSRARARFFKEYQKYTTYQVSYTSLTEKIIGMPKVSDKNNKNEKFFLDKMVQGSQAFYYTHCITMKYIIRTSSVTSQDLPVTIKQDLKILYKYPYDILQLDEVKKVESKAIMSSTGIQNMMSTTNNTSSSSFASTSKTVNTVESIWEVIVSNFEKTLKELQQSNKFISLQIQLYLEKYKKRQDKGLYKFSVSTFDINRMQRDSMKNEAIMSRDLLKNEIVPRDSFKNEMREVEQYKMGNGMMKSMSRGDQQVDQFSSKIYLLQQKTNMSRTLSQSEVPQNKAMRSSISQWNFSSSEFGGGGDKTTPKINSMQIKQLGKCEFVQSKGSIFKNHNWSEQF